MTSTLAVDGGTPTRTAPFPTWPVYDDTEEKALLSVLQSGRWGSTSGEVVARFAEEFCRFQGAAYGVPVANGTLALVAALRAAGVGPGDEVIVTPYTFIASASSVVLSGAVPVFVDVLPDTLLIDPGAAAAAITPRTKAIMAVHIAGCPCDMDALLDVAGAHGISVVEDAAQATGAEWRDRRVGAIGDIGTFSFQSSKNMTAGEGGIIVTDDAALADRAWSLANVGRSRQGAWYQHDIIGWNLRLTEFQAAILRAQLGRVPQQASVRSRNATELTARLNDIPGVTPLRVDDRVTAHGWHLYVVQLAGGLDKQSFLRALTAEGVPCSAGYVTLNRNEALRDAARAAAGDPSLTFTDCPVAQSAERNVAWMPQNILLGDSADVADVADAVAKVAGALTP
jgi:dTDP-4-amino-4,6-dideoxygalactose transaminase